MWIPKGVAFRYCKIIKSKFQVQNSNAKVGTLTFSVGASTFTLALLLLCPNGNAK